MNSITRALIAVAAIGAGLLHAALVADAVRGGSHGALVAVLAVLAAVELTWAVIVTLRREVRAPAAAVTAALLPAAAAGALVVAGLLPAAPALAALPLQVVVAAVVGRHLVRGERRRIAPAGREPAAVLQLVAVFAGCLAVGALITPAIATTDPAANEHGHHGR